ncbi:hypothetical protein HII36_03510 [Nonomuraea sp. NN258]|uniref:hypothetical protein n=1 Tax=Nonomuraea antri TaxID=2730852 RepID=UPI001568D12C|nr:hypothetical protein [Nonomuraea antri]NRQ30906.1 hypothetical protein [Nonomuraea antri]
MSDDERTKIIERFRQARADRQAVEDRYRADLEQHRQTLAPLITTARAARLTTREWADAYGITERHAQRLADELGLPKLRPGGAPSQD